MGVGRVFGLQNDFGVLAVQPLANRLAVECGNHDVAMPRFSASIHKHQVTGKQAGAGHAVVLDLHQVHMRSADIEQLIQEDVFFQVIGCRGLESHNPLKVWAQGLAASETFRDRYIPEPVHELRLQLH